MWVGNGWGVGTASPGCCVGNRLATMLVQGGLAWVRAGVGFGVGIACLELGVGSSGPSLGGWVVSEGVKCWLGGTG